jgi:hypothetical protein
MWSLWSGRLVQSRLKGNEPPEATANTENGKEPVAAVVPITKRVTSRNGKAAEMADRLRLSLTLSETNATLD